MFPPWTRQDFIARRERAPLYFGRRSLVFWYLDLAPIGLESFTSKMTTSAGKHRIVILGGGFGGVYTAMYLDRAMTAAERDKIEVTIVSSENYIVFQPLLPEVVSGTLEFCTPSPQSADLRNGHTFTHGVSKPSTWRTSRCALLRDSCRNRWCWISIIS